MENRYKNGDLVRATADEENIARGEILRVSDTARPTAIGPWVMIEGKRSSVDDGSYLESRFEPWTPKVGERVRFVRDNTAGGRVFGAAGEIATAKQDAATYDDGARIFVGYLHRGDTKFLIAANVYDIEPVIDEPLPVAAKAQPAAQATPAAPLTIQAGKYYKTRDGRKVGPADTKPDNFNVGEVHAGRKAVAVFPTIGDVDATGAWLCGDGKSDHDLIAEWPAKNTTTTNVSATVDALDEEYGPGVAVADVPVAKPKFKVGDRVRVVRADIAQKKRFVGKEFTLTKKSYRIRGEQSWSVGDANCEYLWLESEIVAVPPTTAAIVCKIDNGQPLPNAKPRVHTNVEAADNEAARLASVHKGQEFGVFAMTGTPHKVEKVYDHEWQRLAHAGMRVLAITALRRISGIGLKPARDAVERFIEEAA